MAEESARTIELRDYLEVLGRRKWIIVLAVAIVVVTGVYRSARQTKVYRAAGEILVSVQSESQILTQVSIIEGQAIRDKVTEKVPGAGRAAAGVGRGNIVVITVEDTDPKRAAEAVAAYMSAYVEYRQDSRLEELLRATEQTRARADEFKKQVDALTAEFDAKSEEIDDRALPVPGESQAQIAAREFEVLRGRRELDGSLKARRDALQRNQFQLESSLFELSAAAAITEPVAEVINQAVVPTTPVRPDPLSAAISATVFGLILGIALAFLFEYLDESIKTKEDIQRAVGTGVPVVAAIPFIVDWRDRSKPELVSVSAPRSSAAEAYRSLRTSVQFAGLEKPVNVLAITSPNAGEGKTSAVANLAVVLASAGRRVVILDADLRRPRIHTFFGLSNEVGFTSWIIGSAPLSVAVQEVPGVRRLSIMASGPIPPNPSELLSSRRFADVVKALQADGALVVIDTPPLLPVTDAAVIARSVDAIFMITMAGTGTRRHLRQATEILQRVDAPLVGIVLNGVDPDRYSYSYQGAYYGQPQDASASVPPAKRPKAKLAERLRTQSNGSEQRGPVANVPPTQSGPPGAPGQPPHGQ